MGNALRMGLAGGLMGAMGGLHDRWQETQQEIKTERLRAARKLETDALAKIAAENEAAKDAREHGQAIELEGVKSKTRAELEASKEEGRNKRASEARAAADRRAAASAAARTSTARNGKPAFRKYQTNESPTGWGDRNIESGEWVKDQQGKVLGAEPPYRERQGSGAAPPPRKDAPAASAAPAGPEPIIIDPPVKGAAPKGPRTRADVREQVRPLTSQAEADELLAQANAAIARGAPPDAVKARLRQYGLTLKD